jgi:hypothetical protein
MRRAGLLGEAWTAEPSNVLDPLRAEKEMIGGSFC